MQKIPLPRARTFLGKGRGRRPLEMIKKDSKHPTAPGPKGRGRWQGWWQTRGLWAHRHFQRGRKRWKSSWKSVLHGQAPGCRNCNFCSKSPSSNRYQEVTRSRARPVALEPRLCARRHSLCWETGGCHRAADACNPAGLAAENFWDALPLFWTDPPRAKLLKLSLSLCWNASLSASVKDVFATKITKCH